MKPALLAPLLFAVACASPDEAPIAGSYVGELAIQHTDPLRSVFAVVDLRIAGDGDIGGSRATTKQPSIPVGEVGLLTGTCDPIDTLSVETAWQLELPTHGRFTMSGTLTYSDATGGLAGTLSTRDATLGYIGMTVITVQP